MRFYLSGVPVDILAEDHMGVVTEEEYAALPEAKKKQGLYIVPEAGADLDGSCDIYSTEEQVIGRWIDGKPIYQKIIITTTPSTASTWVSLEEISDLDTLVDLNSYFERGDVSFFGNYGTYIYVGYLTGSKSVGVYIGDSASNYINKPFRIIVKYTKTTDEAIL